MVPEGWLQRRVLDLGDVTAGKAKNAKLEAPPRPYLRTRNVYDGRIDLADVLEMPFTDDEFERYRLRVGDILLNEGQSIELVGRCSMYRGEYPGECAIQNQLVRFRAGPDACPHFAEQLFRWFQRRGRFIEIATQTTSIAHLGVRRFAEMPVVVPPLAEQRKIAAILSSVDEAIERTQAVIDQVQLVKKALMQELLTRGLPGRHTRFKQTEIGEIPESWEVRPVGEVGEVTAGKAKNVKLDAPLRPYLRTKNVYDGCIDLADVLEMPFTDAEFERYRLKSGDILLNEGQSLELVGRCSLYRDEYPGECAIQNQLVRFRAGHRTCPEFAEQLFRWCQSTGRFIEIATQTTSIAHLGVRRFAELALPWPGPNEQKEIAAILEHCDARASAERRTVEGLTFIKAGLSSALLSGEVRVQTDDSEAAA